MFPSLEIDFYSTFFFFSPFKYIKSGGLYCIGCLLASLRIICRNGEALFLHSVQSDSCEIAAGSAL